MAGKNVGALLVCENDRLVGIVSERDCAGGSSWRAYRPKRHGSTRS
jgi:hypothetical protein